MPPSVLVVDDNAALLRLIERMLADQPVEVVLAGSVDHARKRLRERSFDVLLTDVHLGQDSGLQLASDSLRKQPWLSVIVMSGLLSREDLPTEFDIFLAKPFARAELLAAFRNAGKL